MMKANYDEYQLAIRYRVSTQAFIIICALTFVNGIVNDYYIWATFVTQSLVLIMIPVLYCIIVMTLKGAYISNNDKNPFITIGCFIFLAIIGYYGFVSGYLREGMEFIIKDNMLNADSQTLIMAIFWTIVSVTNLYKYRQNRKQEEE